MEEMVLITRVHAASCKTRHVFKWLMPEDVTKLNALVERCAKVLCGLTLMISSVTANNVKIIFFCVKVCGTDGETYDNICELQTQSSNARMDYLGECVEPDDPATSVRDRCRSIRSSMDGRCPELPDCVSRINPEDGCCPICGNFGLNHGFSHYVFSYLSFLF